MKIANAYRGLVRQITAVYDEREARNIARLVFEDAFGVRNLNRDDGLPPEQVFKLQEITQRLTDGEPLQYVLGQADFYGLKFRVTRDTLIPRAETEELVYEILQDHPAGPVRSALDIGTGTGCIPLTLKHHRPNWSVEGLDVSQSALKVARQNAAQLGTAVNFLQADILDEGNWPQFPVYDIIVSNPPYIDANDDHLQRGDLRYEPRNALVADENGLAALRTLAQNAPRFLTPGGVLLLEHGYTQANTVREMLVEAGFHNIETRRDLAGCERVTGGALRAD